MKKNLNIKLLIQITKAQRLTPNVYIAIPKPNYSLKSSKWRDICFLIKRLELGLILVDIKTMKINIVFEPKQFNKKSNLNKFKKQKINLIKEINGRSKNYNIGGVKSEKQITAYKENAIFIACALNKLGPSSPKELKNIGTGEKTQSILYKNFYGWFNSISRGVYDINDEGKKAIDFYSEISNYYKKKLP